MSAYAASAEALNDREPSRRAPRAARSFAAVASRSTSDGVRADAALGDLLNAIAERVAEAVVARLEEQPAEELAEWLDARQAADYLGMHRDTLRRLAAERSIPSEQDRPGCKLHFRRSELDAWRRSDGRATHLAAVA